jgi:CheY-like chemotaxis protein
MTATASTVLLVDDDKPTRHILRRWLTYLGVRSCVLEAEDGEQALALVKEYCQRSNEPRSLLVLLDLNMPVMDGLEFLEHQLQLPTHCQQVMAVIVVSATPNRAEVKRAQTMAVDVRGKPLDILELGTLVREYLPAALPATT